MLVDGLAGGQALLLDRVSPVTRSLRKAEPPEEHLGSARHVRRECKGGENIIGPASVSNDGIKSIYLGNRTFLTSSLGNAGGGRGRLGGGPRRGWVV